VVMESVDGMGLTGGQGEGGLPVDGPCCLHRMAVYVFQALGAFLTTAVADFEDDVVLVQLVK